MYTIDIDVGGTLTDGLFSDGSAVTPVKVDTTPHDLTVCFQACLTEGATKLGFADLRSFLEQVSVIRWSTTITANVLAQRAGPKLGLLVSAGQEANLYGDRPSVTLGALIDPANVMALSQPLDEVGVLTAVKRLLENGIRRVCVSFAGSFNDGGDERQVKRLIETQYPDHFLGSVPVLLSSEICKFPDDNTRTHMALINAYIHDPLATGLFKAEDDLRYTHGYSRPFLIGHANGGVARVAKTTAVDTLESGPTMGIFGSAYLARQYGLDRVLSLDVGGTTTKASLILNGEPVLTDHGEIFSIPVKMPLHLLHSIALGGGSVAQVDEQSHHLRLGPESQGAYPGPACYGLGGDEATFTDACVALGYINPAHFLGGARQLDVARAREVIAEKVAGPLGVGSEAASVQIVHLASDIVADAMRELLRERGQKPEDFTLFAFGGNGAILAAGTVERVGLRQAYVFDLGSVFSAFGSSVSDIVHTYTHAIHLPLNSAELAARLNAIVSYMIGEAHRDMLGEGLDASQVTYALELEVSPESGPPQTVRLPFTQVLGAAELSQIAHLAGQPAAQLVVEVARLKTTFPMPRLALPSFPLQGADPSGAARGKRPVSWDGQATDTPIYDWDALQAGNIVAGPAVVEGQTTTYLVPAHWTLTMDEHRNGLLSRKG